MIPYKTVEKSWGHEAVYFGAPFSSYCVKKLIYVHRIASSLHYHERKHETFCVLKGRFRLEVGPVGAGRGGEPIFRTLIPGDVYILPPMTRHRLRRTSKGTGVVLECSTADAPDDCVRIEPSEMP